MTFPDSVAFLFLSFVCLDVSMFCLSMSSHGLKIFFIVRGIQTQHTQRPDRVFYSEFITKPPRQKTKYAMIIMRRSNIGVSNDEKFWEITKICHAGLSKPFFFAA